MKQHNFGAFESSDHTCSRDLPLRQACRLSPVNITTVPQNLWLFKAAQCYHYKPKTNKHQGNSGVLNRGRGGGCTWNIQWLATLRDWLFFVLARLPDLVMLGEEMNNTGNICLHPSPCSIAEHSGYSYSSLQFLNWNFQFWMNVLSIKTQFAFALKKTAETKQSQLEPCCQAKAHTVLSHSILL